MEEKLTEVKGSLGDTKGKILDLLLDSPKTAGEIAEKLKIQKSAVRSHLESLKSEKAVTSYFKLNVERLGRPGKVYELTENGREQFVRKYDEILSLVLKKISERNGQDQMRRIVESIADEIAEDVTHRIQKNGNTEKIEEKLKKFNSISNEMGFMSSLNKEKDGTFSITSKNCILHKIALKNQDIICHGLHDRIIMKSLNQKKSDTVVELKDCIVLGNNSCKHIIKKR